MLLAEILQELKAIRSALESTPQHLVKPADPNAKKPGTTEEGSPPRRGRPRKPSASDELKGLAD